MIDALPLPIIIIWVCSSSVVDAWLYTLGLRQSRMMASINKETVLVMLMMAGLMNLRSSLSCLDSEFLSWLFLLQDALAHASSWLNVCFHDLAFTLALFRLLILSCFFMWRSGRCSTCSNLKRICGRLLWVGCRMPLVVGSSSISLLVVFGCGKTIN